MEQQDGKEEINYFPIIIVIVTIASPVVVVKENNNRGGHNRDLHSGLSSPALSSPPRSLLGLLVVVFVVLLSVSARAQSGALISNGWPKHCTGTHVLDHHQVQVLLL